MAQRIIGLDLGSRFVKAVVLEGSFRGFTVERTLEAPVPQDLDADEETGPRPYHERLAEALEALKAQELPKVDAVYTAVPGNEVSTHLLTLPFTDARKIEQTLPFELEDQLPFDLEEVAYDHQVLGQRDGKTEVLVGVVKKEVLADLLATLQAAELDPRVIGLSSLSFQNLFAHGVIDGVPQGEPAGAKGKAKKKKSKGKGKGKGREAPRGEGPRPEGEAPSEPGSADAQGPRVEAVLDLGHVSTDLLVVEDGTGRFARSFPMAGKALTAAIASAEGLSADEAEALKEAEARLPANPSTVEDDPRRARLAAAVSRGVAPIVRGVRQTFMAWQARARNRITKVYLTGGTSRLPGLADHLARELDVEVVPLDPFPPDAEGKRPDADPLAGLALALALRGQAGARSARVNFRKGPFAFRGDLSYLKGNVARLGVLAAILLVLVGLNVFARFRMLSAEEARVDEAMCQLTEKVLDTCYTNADDAISRLRGTKAAGSRIPAVSAAEVLAEVTRRLSGLEDVELSELDIAGGKVRLQGDTGSFDAVARVVKALQDWNCFGEVTQGQTRQGRRSDRIEFNVDAVMTAECTS